MSLLVQKLTECLLLMVLSLLSTVERCKILGELVKILYCTELTFVLTATVVKPA